MPKHQLFAFIMVAIFLVLVGALWWNGESITRHMSGTTDLQSRGQYGDQYNTITSLFTGIAVVAAAAGFFLQAFSIRHEHDSSKRRDFEHSFFALVGIHREMADRLRVPGTHNREEVEGIDIFDDVRRELDRELRGSTRDESGYIVYGAPPQPSDKKDRVRAISAAYMNVYKRGYGNALGHYFRMLYRIMRFIDESELSDSQRRQYAGLLRATLSQMEVLILYYNCLSEVGTGFMKLARKYELFQHLPESMLLAGAFDASLSKCKFYQEAVESTDRD